MRDRRRGRWLQAILLLAGLVAPALPAAEALEGILEVRSAFVTVDRGVYEVSATVQYPVNEDIRKALLDGVTLSFEFQSRVSGQRRWWADDVIVDLTLARELSWHAVSGRYVVRENDRGELGSFLTLEQALQALGAVEGWPVAVDAQLEPDVGYEVAVRASVRRGKLPYGLRTLIWWSGNWQRSSDWYVWTLPR
ncbi:MAG: hypothetical protein RL026_776 [Pseudomonadota bacterium]|jgi:hypothetical protein